MKVLVTADVHLHPFPAFSSLENNVNTRLLRTMDVLEQLVTYANDNNITNIFIIGDLFHKRGTIDVITYELIANYFYTNKNINFCLLAGNHDQATMDDTYTSLRPLQYSNVHVITSQCKESLNNKSILFVPYRPDHEEITKSIQNDSADYLFGHFAVAGAKIINTDFVLSTGAKLSRAYEQYSAILLGHYHTPQYLSKKHSALYVGSPLHHTFHDEGQQKSFVELDLESGGLVRVDTKYPRFIRVNVSSNEQLETCNLSSEDYFRIICNNFTPSVDLLNTLTDNGNNYELIIESHNTKEEGAQAYSDKSLLLQYVKENVKSDKRSVYTRIQEIINNVKTQ